MIEVNTPLEDRVILDQMSDNVTDYDKKGAESSSDSLDKSDYLAIQTQFKNLINEIIKSRDYALCNSIQVIKVLREINAIKNRLKLEEKGINYDLTLTSSKKMEPYSVVKLSTSIEPFETPMKPANPTSFEFVFDNFNHPLESEKSPMTEFKVDILRALLDEDIRGNEKKPLSSSDTLKAIQISLMKACRDDDIESLTYNIFRMKEMQLDCNFWTYAEKKLRSLLNKKLPKSKLI